jgi:HD-GYP domain-containing protein (c-di-GMP phosphodiesterase class II)
MWKKIKVEDLQVGMVVVDVGRSWMNHPFLTKQKRIHSPKDIQKLKDYGIQEVSIETETETDSPFGLSGKEENRFPAEDIAGEIKKEGPSLPPFPGRVPENEVAYKEEIKIASGVQQEAHSLVRDYMQDIRAGKNIESQKVKRVINQMIDSIFRNLEALTSLTRIKGYDEYTFIHSVNVCILCLALGRHLNLSHEEMQQIGIGALLHDIGKMKVPPHILNKRGKVTEEEYIEIKKHPLYTLEVLEKAEGIPDASVKMALQHHERYNGKGYPYGLSGDQISPFGQIAAIIDVYDAITSDRCYKMGIPPHEGIKRIYEWAKSDFSAVLVEKFIQCIGIYPAGTLVQLDTDEVGIVYSINREKILRPKVLLIFKDSNWRYPKPVLVDLMKNPKDAQSFQRSIVKPLDPLQWNINVEKYLPKAPSPANFN